MTPIIIVEGLDRMGKSTLIKNIMDKYGFYSYIHYEKPQHLKVYENASSNPLYMHQHMSFVNGFSIIENNVAPSVPGKIIFDRFHLGEYVYSPLYRGYSGDYVFELEKSFLNRAGVKSQNITMVLLTSSNFDILEDDGLSFDVNKRHAEQELFKTAFEKSQIPKKIMIDVHNGNCGFKTPQAILQEIV